MKWGHEMNSRSFVVAIFVFTMLVSGVMAEDKRPAQPSKKDKCPVCGMFVYKYPDWVGEILFSDGSVHFFDGAKDLFKYYFNLKKYNPAKTIEDISAIYVTEYYDMKIIDAKTAFFVIGSDVYGPMGKELIPFVSKADAEAFKKDHKGTRILRFDDIKPGIIKKLD
jgi:nitrous oxide reductase accessory protein NosL